MANASEILQRHRTVFRVRTARGAEGWVDERQLLAASDMQNLKRLAQAAAKLPSQGAATPRYGDLRVYTLPSRESPAFLTVKEKDKVDVLAHVVTPRAHVPRAPILPPTPKKVLAKKKTKEPAIPPVPMPKPPTPPADWQDLSKTESEEVEEPADTPPTPTDDWSLVRTADGEAGWTLTRWLNMAIPDEVAQYAEGRRIVSYFSLGSLRDGDQTKNIWLWTTIGGGSHRLRLRQLPRFHLELAPPSLRNQLHRAQSHRLCARHARKRDLRRGAVSRLFSMYPEEGRHRATAGITRCSRTSSASPASAPCETQTQVQDLAAAAVAKPGSGPPLRQRRHNLANHRWPSASNVNCTRGLENSAYPRRAKCAHVAAGGSV